MTIRSCSNKNLLAGIFIATVCMAAFLLLLPSKAYAALSITAKPALNAAEFDTAAPEYVTVKVKNAPFNWSEEIAGEGPNPDWTYRSTTIDYTVYRKTTKKGSSWKKIAHFKDDIDDSPNSSINGDDSWWALNKQAALKSNNKCTKFDFYYQDQKTKLNKKYKYKVTIKTGASNPASYKSKTASCWTVPCNGYKGEIKKGQANWKKAKNGCTGYLVSYETWTYRGYNAWRDKVYKVKHCYKFVNGTSVFLGGNVKNVHVDPYTKHGDKYYIHEMNGQRNSKKALAKNLLKGSETVLM